MVAVNMGNASRRQNKLETVYLRLGNDVRQSLHNIMGLLELMAEEPLSECQKEYLLRCRRSADRLLLTANDVSEIAECEPLVLHPGPMSLRAVVEETVELMSVLARRKGLRMTGTVARGLPQLVVGDRQLIEDLLRRLVDNSIKYTGRGGIDLSVKLIDQPGIANPGGDLLTEFTIADTGPGLPPNVFEYLQVPFLDPPLPGLGLMVVRTRLAAIGGSLEVLTSSPAGTAIGLRVPVAMMQRALSIEAGEAATPEADPLDILVVEDSDDSYSLLVAFLQETPHRIFRAHDGTYAVERVKTHRYDIVLMDIMMPEMDGFEATAAIRRWEEEQSRKPLPIILLSAEDPTRQRRQGLAAGCSGFLMKPCRKQDVCRLLEEFWRKREVAGGPDENKSVITQ